MHFQRTILGTIRKHIHTPEAIFVTGMRRVGKTTLLRMIYDEIPSDNKVFLDLDNIIEQKVFEEDDFKNILQNLKAYGIRPNEKCHIFIDEIQAKPESVKAVKYLIDHFAVKFFITGSSSYYLKNLFPESLSGRKILFELFPLSFEEFLIFKGRKKQVFGTFREKEKNKNQILYEQFKGEYQEYIEFGGFPQIALSDDSEYRRMILKDIFTSYFEKDVRLLSHFRQITSFRDLLLLLIQRAGSKLDVSKLSSELGLSRETVYSYLSFLEGTYFIAPVSPYSPNPDREVSGSRKIYFCDTGIINQFGKISGGVLLENACFNRLKTFGKVNYYQRRTGIEIDFVMPEKDAAFEVKNRGTSADVRQLRKLAASLGIKESYVVSQAYSEDEGVVLAMDL